MAEPRLAAFTCRECRALLPAYIDRELAPAARSRVSAHLDDCDRCHAEYTRQRALAADLRAGLPALGRLDAARAGLLWSAVQTDLASPRRAALPVGQARMSLVVLLMAAALLLPWLVSTGRLAALSLPLPPTPVSADALATDAPLAPEARAPQAVVFHVTPPGAPEYAPTQAPHTPFLPVSR
jgi:anti-sigma factor RsiW